jgi:acyl-CoA synthetase (AMP-forming)/AMP-acid ligase II
MAQYWGLPKETAETLVDGWVRTGDVARRDEEGYLYIVDRKKDVIITGAFNVYPKEVEDVLYRHPAVADAAVVGVPDAEWGEAIKAFVVLRPQAACTAEELVQLCREHLASYKKPRVVEFVDSLPMSPVGKIMRRALKGT